MPKEVGHSSEIAASEYTANSLPADENTPLVREANSTSRQHRLCEHFNCRHFLLGVFLLFLLAEVAVLTPPVLLGILDINSNNTLQECYQVSNVSINMAIALNLVEIINCCFFLGIIVKSPSFVGFSTVFKDLGCLPKFWTLLLSFILYLIAGIICIHTVFESFKRCCAQDHSLCDYYCVTKLTIVEMILEILNFFIMMILVVFLNHTNLRYTISGHAWVYRTLKGTLVMFCFRFFVPVVSLMMTLSIALTNGPSQGTQTAKIISEILILPFCKKIMELLWKKIFFDEKCIIGKIKRNKAIRQITFVV